MQAFTSVNLLLLDGATVDDSMTWVIDYIMLIITIAGTGICLPCRTECQSVECNED